MPSPKEVEIKFRITRPSAVGDALQSAGFERVTPSTREINTLYDLPGQKLRKRGELLRLRRYGKEWILTYKAKGKAGRHKSRIELEARVEKGEKMDAILRALGYIPTFRYEKYRAEWGDGSGHVVVDRTPIGWFGEVEGPPQWIDRTAKTLGIARTDYITETYAGLFFAWKRGTHSPATEMTFRAIPGRRAVTSRGRPKGTD
jgi:adenylate cyclase class 2